MKIRQIEEKDIEQVRKIYKKYIEETTITFEYDVPSIEVFKKRVLDICRTFPWLVYEVDKKVVGYAYASRYKERAAFSWDCELSVYIDEKFQHQGIGQKLYKALLSSVKLQGYFNIYALICVPNVGSESLHKSMGFEKEGHFSKIGYKFHQWLDLAQYVYRVDPPVNLNHFPIAFDEISIKEREAIFKESELIKDRTK